MKHDLDRLMQERGLDAVLVAGQVLGNPTLAYMLNGAAVSYGYVVKKRGQPAVFYCSPIEREEALASGLIVENLAKLDYLAILREKGDRLAADVELHRRILADQGIRGRVGFYGMVDRGRGWLLLNALAEQLEGIEICAEYDANVFDVARATKDAKEVEAIRAVGRATCEIVGETVEFLKSHSVRNGALVQPDGKPLTLGEVRRFVQRQIAAHGLEDPEGFIFSIGRDAAIPHSKGRTQDIVELGKTIVFDIFPRQPGGYYFDMTRTFCVGFAPPEVERVHQDVVECVDKLLAAYRVGTPVREYQKMTCEFFEARGHPTIASDTKTESGYVHSVGHGVGLAVHEEPFFSDTPSNTTVLSPGHLFSCEPGLYYPERGYGVRIEDLVWVDENGTVHDLTDFPKDLVIER